MGYTTEFEGHLKVEPPLNDAEITYLKGFNETRRMIRQNGPYFLDLEGNYGQNRLPDVIDYNKPPEGQPGLWCQWTPCPEQVQAREEAREEGVPDHDLPVVDKLVWDGGEKFYYATEWLTYIINHFVGLAPKAREAEPENFDFLQGHVCNGWFNAYGEERGDVWHILIDANNVTSGDHELCVECIKPLKKCTCED